MDEVYDYDEEFLKKVEEHVLRELKCDHEAVEIGTYDDRKPYRVLIHKNES